MYLNLPYKIYYDTLKYPFKELVCKIFDVEDLEKLHDIEFYDVLTRERDQKTTWHKKYYNNFKEVIEPYYLQLVNEIKLNLGYESIIYQKIPTIRVQLGNGNVAVGEWHKDKTYNHGVSEVNFWLPFMDTNEFNSVWIESKEDLGDYRAFKVNYGEILVFNGANLNHGNVNNTSNKTRVSFDFRLVDPTKFIPNDNGSINLNTKFKIGEYFEIM